MVAPNLLRPAFSGPYALHSGLRRPPRGLAQLKDIVIEVEEVGGLAPVLTLSLSPVLARPNDGPRDIPIAVGPHNGPTDALTWPFLIAVDTPPVGRTASP